MRNVYVFLLLGLYVPAILAQAPNEPKPDVYVAVDKLPKVLNFEAVKADIPIPKNLNGQPIVGNVLAKILVDTNGNYIKHIIIRSVDSLLTATVAAYAPKLKFLPAMRQNTKVMCWVLQTFSFSNSGIEGYKPRQHRPYIVFSNKDTVYVKKAQIANDRYISLFVWDSTGNKKKYDSKHVVAFCDGSFVWVYLAQPYFAVGGSFCPVVASGVIRVYEVARNRVTFQPVGTPIGMNHSGTNNNLRMINEAGYLCVKNDIYFTWGYSAIGGAFGDGKRKKLAEMLFPLTIKQKPEESDTDFIIRAVLEYNTLVKQQGKQ